MMRTSSPIVAALIGLGLLACTDSARTTAPGATLVPSSASAARNTLSAVSLVVTVADVDNTGAAYGIRSDGRGVYTNGTQNVQAEIDQYGTFAFNTSINARQTTQRSVVYDFSRPVDPANTFRPTAIATSNYHFSTGPSMLLPAVPLQNLGVNGNPVSQCMYMGNSVPGVTTKWKVSFHKGYEDFSTSPAAYAVFTRTSVSPASWVAQPAGSCSPNSNVASVRNDDATILYGYYYLPFYFTLEAR
jgi:hypothetical protein